MSTVKRQHFVPQFYLRGFAMDEDRKQIHVFDKVSRVQSVEKIRDVAQLPYFYDADKIDSTVGQAQFLEKMFGRMESRVAPLLLKIIDSATTLVQPEFTDDDLGEIVAFVAFQFLRTHDARVTITQAWRLLADHLSKVHGPQVLAELPALGTGDLAQLHGESLQNRDLLMRIGASLVKRSWAVRVILEHGPLFITSDNPVVYAPVVSTREPHGIESPHVAVGLPLSPKVMLTFLPKETDGRFDEIEAFGITAAEVAEFNRMQVTRASGQVFSSTGDFHLAKELLREAPAMADSNRPRWRVSGGPGGAR